MESALHALPGVAEAAVVAVKHGDSHQLAGFVCWREGHAGDQAELQALLRQPLPLYMIPQQWAELERLPRTSNGKVDRQRLAEDAVRLAGRVARANQGS